MNEESVQYQPKFPRAHMLLLNAYGTALKSTSEESVLWCERFKAIVRGWEALKGDGLLPPLFTENFWEDVEDVMKRIHHDINLNKLSGQQQLMPFAIANLRVSFGGN